MNISTVAGNTAPIGSPSSVAFDTSGNLFVADGLNNVIQAVAKADGFIFGTSVTAGHVYTIVGTGTAGNNGDGGPASAASITGPGITIDSAGNLYIADYSNNRIRIVVAANGTLRGIPVTAGNIYAYAGNGTQGYNGSGSNGVSAMFAEFYNPGWLVTDSVGNLYISENGNGAVRVVAAVSGTFLGIPMSAGNVYVVAGGNGNEGNSGDGGPAVRASLSHPTGIALDTYGNLYINSGQEIRMVAARAGTVFGVTATAPGNIYTVAGTGTAGYNGDNIPALSAELGWNSAGLTLDGSGNLYIADGSNPRIRVVAAATGTLFGVSVIQNYIYTIVSNPPLVNPFSITFGP